MSVQTKEIPCRVVRGVQLSHAWRFVLISFSTSGMRLVTFACTRCRRMKTERV